MKTTMTHVYLNDCALLCALGSERETIRRHLLVDAASGLAISDACSPGRPLPLGRVQTALPGLGGLPLQLRSRNNALALAALAQIRPAIDAAIARHGAARVGVVIGTSTSGVSAAESALAEQLAGGALPDSFHYCQQEMGSVAELLSRELGIGGPAYVHSSACS